MLTCMSYVQARVQVLVFASIGTQLQLISKLKHRHEKQAQTQNYVQVYLAFISV